MNYQGLFSSMIQVYHRVLGKRLLLLFFALLVVSTVSAQREKEDSTRIDKLDQYFYAYPWVGVPDFSVKFDSLNPKQGDFSRKYQFNGRNLLGIALGYKKIFVALSFKQPYEIIPEIPEVKSSSWNFNANYRGKKLLFELTYKKFKGFYEPNIDGDSVTDHLRRNDLYYRYYKVKGIYIFSPHKFSYNAAYLYKAWQKKSGGSFLLYGEYWNSKMTADSSFLPNDFANEQFWQHLEKVKVNSLGAAGGYAITLVAFQRFFFSFFLAAGLNLQYKNYAFAENFDPIGRMAVAGAVDSRASFGFNSERFFVTLNAKNDINLTRIRGVRTTATYNFVSINIGYRFIPPSLFRKAYDWSPFNRGIKPFLPKKKAKKINSPFAH